MALRFAVLMRMRLPGRCAAEQRRAEHQPKESGPRHGRPLSAKYNIKSGVDEKFLHIVYRVCNQLLKIAVL